MQVASNELQYHSTFLFDSHFSHPHLILLVPPSHSQTVTFDVREEAVGIGQPDSVAKYGIGESVSNSGVLEDDYGIAVQADSFVDIVTGVDPGRFAGKSGRIGEEVNRRGLGFGLDGKPAAGEDKNKDKHVVTDGEEGDYEGINNEKMLEVADLSSGKGIIKGRNGRPPIKVSVIPRKLEVLAEVVYAPLEGRVDARAARQSVRALQPRHLVIIGGPRSNALLLAYALCTTTTPVISSSKDGMSSSSSNNVVIMKEKRDYVLAELAKMEGVSVAVPPNGAFYVLPDVSKYYNGDDTQLCLDLLKEKKLALVPGESFGAPGTVRISYATSMEELEVAMTKLREFLEERL